MCIQPPNPGGFFIPVFQIISAINKGNPAPSLPQLRGPGYPLQSYCGGCAAAKRIFTSIPIAKNFNTFSVWSLQHLSL